MESRMTLVEILIAHLLGLLILGLGDMTDASLHYLMRSCSSGDATHSSDAFVKLTTKDQTALAIF